MYQRTKNSLTRSAKELARAVAELERRNRELDEFVNTVAHDLNAPVRTVINFCELLQRRCSDQLDEQGQQYLGFVVESAQQMQRLINDLREYAQVTHKRHQLKPVDCELVLTAAKANLRTQIEETRAEVTHDPLPTVRGDVTQLTQVFQNLIGNAIKYLDGRAPKVHVSAKSKADQWRFSVRDNGIGIERKNTRRIFRMFGRLHAGESEYKGTGVGLAICKNVVERHGGRIGVESKLGEGSEFWFTIPSDESQTGRTGSQIITTGDQ